MTYSSTLHKFRVDLSDTDRNLYETLEFRAAFHPSESAPFFAVRALAYCLNAREGLEFSGGISTPDEPAIYVKDPTGRLVLWIDVGQPDPRRLHKASKLGAEVKVYSQRDPFHYLGVLKAEDLYRKPEIRLHSFEPGFPEEVARTLDRDNAWALTVSGGSLYLSAGNREFHSEIHTHPLQDA